MDVTVVKLYHIGPELLVHLICMYVTESGQQTTDDGAAAAVPAGTAAGTGTGVSADTGSTSE